MTTNTGNETIGFNKPYFSGNEVNYILDAVYRMKISGDGYFTKKCHQYFEEVMGFSKALLTNSCTDALEMAAILCEINPGDEVIMPSYTFVSTANAFVLRGANIRFVDSMENNPNMDASQIQELITPKTKAIVPVHYAGVACAMEEILEIGRKNNLYVIEDAAQAIDSYYKKSDGKLLRLGGIGHLAAFSFHETKNIISGEGGLLCVNDPRMVSRAEIIREKGTNRSAFFRGEVDKYNWVDIGSSFLPSDIIAAFLFAQLESIAQIQRRRKEIWNLYFNGLKSLEEKGFLKLPQIPEYATNNAHMFYVVCNNLAEREALTSYLKNLQIHAVFHYLSLHKSPYYKNKHDGRALPWSDHYSDCLLRLPFYYELSDESVTLVVEKIMSFYQK